MCLLVGWFQTDSLDQMWNRQGGLPLFFVIDTQIEADAGQAGLQLLGFARARADSANFPCAL
jgi:hypothetical protein